MSEPSIWPSLGRMWGELAVAVEKEDEDSGNAALVSSLAKLTRNLVAGIAQNQEQALCAVSSVGKQQIAENRHKRFRITHN